MKLRNIFLISIPCMLMSCSDKFEQDGKDAATYETVFTLDDVSNLKNPYMGWTLYAEGGQLTGNPSAYWYLQDEAAEKYAGVFYLRWRWSDLEPEEGVYAWDCTDYAKYPICRDFQNYIKGALDRGLRLAFRIYVNGRDNHKAATPQYVLDGAETYIVEPGHRTPYADDEFFLEKYEKFIAAFGKEFNDPSIVDYVDSYGLGWWGEEHHIEYKNPNKKLESHNRIVRAYAKAFDKVINVINFGVRTEEQENVVYDELGFTSRRDGYASVHFPVSQQKEFVTRFPETPIIAEACYWGGAPISNQEGGKWPSWKDYYRDVVALALDTHANYLDLRTETETARYLEDALSDVKAFVSKGGYRIWPVSVSYCLNGKKLEVVHKWKNSGVGVLPNNNVHLRNKYKVSIAVFDRNRNMVLRVLSDKIDLSRLIGELVLESKESLDLSSLPSGSYTIGVGIINTIENDSKDIRLAVKNTEVLSGEYISAGELKL